MTTRTRRSKRGVAQPPLLSITCWDRVEAMQGPEAHQTLQALTFLFDRDMVTGETLVAFLKRVGFTPSCALHYVEVLASLTDA